MRVLLAGASGTLGRALVPALLAAGHDVIGVTRSSDSARRLAGLGASTVVADVLDREALLGALRRVRADAVMHQLTALASAPMRYGSMTATNELRERGTAHLVEAAHAVGAGRMLTQSIVFGYGFGATPGVVDESSPFAVPTGGGVDPVLAALASTESQVRSADGLDGVALRYGLLYGRDVDTIARMLRRRMLPVTAWDGHIPFIHHDDAAAATVAALERGVAGRAYDVADATPVSWRTAIGTAATALLLPAPLRVPPGLLRVAAPYAAELMTRMDLRVSSDLARRELGWEPRFPSVAEGWAHSATQR